MNSVTQVQEHFKTVSEFPETADIETASEDYARRFAGEVGAWLLQLQALATLQMLAAYPGAAVLDGGGHGQLALPYPDRAFDVVLSYRLLAHVSQRQPFLAELCRVAKTAVVVDYPAVKSVNDIAPQLFQLKVNSPWRF